MAEMTSDQIVESILDNPDAFIKILERYRDNKKRLSYLDSITSSQGLITITQIAKDYGLSGQSMNTLLHKLGVQYKQSNQWMLYDRFQSKGYTQTLTLQKYHSWGQPFVVYNTLWTQKGREFLYLFLKKRGIVPLCEMGAEV